MLKPYECSCTCLKFPYANFATCNETRKGFTVRHKLETVNQTLTPVVVDIRYSFSHFSKFCPFNFVCMFKPIPM